MKTTRCTFPTSLLREGEAIGADERSEIGGDFRGDFLEFVAGGVAGQLKTLYELASPPAPDPRHGPVITVTSYVPADIKNDVRAHWFTPHEKAARTSFFM